MSEVNVVKETYVKVHRGSIAVPVSYLVKCWWDDFHHTYKLLLITGEIQIINRREFVHIIKEYNIPYKDVGEQTYNTYSNKTKKGGDK